MRKERKVVLRFYLLLFTKKWKPEKKKKNTSKFGCGDGKEKMH